MQRAERHSERCEESRCKHRSEILRCAQDDSDRDFHADSGRRSNVLAAFANPRRAALGAALLVCLTVSGCTSSGPSPAVLEARRLCQLGKFHDAIDALKDDDSAEASYLKSVAMHRLKLPDSAKPQIEAAVAAHPENPKYQAFQLRLQLLGGETTVAPKIIELYKRHTTSAAVALMAFYGYEGTRMEQLIGKQKEAAAESHKLALDALKSAIVLNSEIPEFQRELLVLATKLKLGKEAQALADKLAEVAPDDPEITKQRIAVLLQTGRMVTALEACEKLYKQENQSEAAATVYAIPLSMLAPSTEHDRKFREIVDRYPANPEIATKFGVYMTRTGRHDAVAEVVNRAVAAQKKPSIRQKLIYVAIDLPLEVGQVEHTQRALDRYRDEIDDPLLISYFEGRILYLQNKPIQAIEKLKLVFEDQKKNPGSNLGLATEALKWMKLILTTQLGNRNLEQVEKAIDQLETATRRVGEELQQDDPDAEQTAGETDSSDTAPKGSESTPPAIDSDAPADPAGDQP